MADGAFPGPLTEREAATLAFMLSPDDPRLVPLREQAGTALVAGPCGCGCASIDLAVDRDRARPATGLASPAVAYLTPDPSDAGRMFWLDLWITSDGWLSGLEVSYVDHAPGEFPPLDMFAAPTTTRA